MISKYSTRLVNNDLQYNDWLQKKEYLESYSIDSSNPYTPYYYGTYNSSGYFVSVSYYVLLIILFGFRLIATVYVYDRRMQIVMEICVN